MNSNYKSGSRLNKQNLFLERKDEIEIDSYNFMDDLFSESDERIKNALIYLITAVKNDNSILSNGIIFSAVLEVVDSPVFELYDLALEFFYFATFDNGCNERALATIISPRFLSLLHNIFFMNNEKLNSILFEIYANIIYTSEFFARQIINQDFLIKMFDFAMINEVTQGPFLNLLFCIIKRYKVIIDIQNENRDCQGYIDLFDFIYNSIVYFVESSYNSQQKIEIKCAIMNNLRQITATLMNFNEENPCLPFQNFSRKLFDINMLFYILQAAKHENQDFRDGALATLLNFSALNDDTREILIEAGLIDIEILPSFYDSIDYFADIANNFFSAIHSISIIFADSILWKSLIANYQEYSFKTKQKIARALCRALQTPNDDDLIAIILKDAPFVIDVFKDCFDENISADITSSIENLINNFSKWNEIESLNHLFELMIQNDFEEIFQIILETPDSPTKLQHRIFLIHDFLTKFIEEKK